MFIYFDRNGVLQEVINDKAARLGDLNANEIYVYVDEVELDDIWLTLKRPDGTLSVEKSFIANKVVREIPYDPKRDMKFFKDFKEYEFYKFTISDEITIAGVYQATIRMTYEDTLSALGVLVFKAETGVIKSDQTITQAQYDYLIWYVGSWQGQIGDLEEAMGIAQADILGLKNRMNVAEQDINKIEDGTTVVDKALKDDLGNTIKSTYANKLDLVYSSSNNRIAITLKSYDGTPIDADLIDLPKATPSADGLLAKEDKVKINNIASDISGAVNTHDTNNTAHLYLRTLIENLQREIARLDGKGKSFGIIDKTMSQLTALPNKDAYILAFLQGKYSGYVNDIGNLIYTKRSQSETEHELEWNGGTWVDNGVWLISPASNSQMGMVQGDNDYVNIVSGIIQVLKSDYATNLGTSGASYDYTTLKGILDGFVVDLTNIYTKDETYSDIEIEQRLTDLLAVANLQDVLIGSYTDGQTVLASDLSPYNFVIALGKDGNDTYTGTFKPSEIVSGNIVSLSPTVYLTRGATNYTITTPTTVKLWGIKLDGIAADEISYDGTISGLSSTNVKTAIDELSSEKADKTYVDAQDLLKADKTYVDSQDALKADKLVLTNLVSNGDLLVAKPSPNQNEALGFTYNDVTDITLNNGVATFTATASLGRIQQTITYPDNSTIYYFAKVKTASPNVGIGIIYASSLYHSGDNTYRLLSFVHKNNPTTQPIKLISVRDFGSGGFIPIEVDYIGAINLTAIFGAGNEPTKEQMDLIINRYGYFQELTLNLKDIFRLIHVRGQRYTPTLLNGATSTNLFYTKDQNDFVDLAGRVITDLGAEQSIGICTLPTGYRPRYSRLYSVKLSGGSNPDVNIYIGSNGEVRVYNSGTIDLAIRFPTT